MDGAYRLREVIDHLREEGNRATEAPEFRARLKNAQSALADYEKRLKAITEQTPDVEDAYRQNDQVKGLEKKFADLGKAVDDVLEEP